MAEEFDIIVLGLGVGGEEVGGRLADAGLRVLGIENRLVGGECPYWGCIPSKMMIRASGLLAEGRRIDGMAGHAEIAPDWAPVALRIRDEATDSWNDQVAVDRFTKRGGTFLRGTGRLTGPGQVEVDGKAYRASRGVVVATGTAPVIPPIPGLGDTPFWTNREAIEADTLPKSLTVLGGGAIGVELAQMFARFGVRVCVIESGERLLSMEEPEASKLVEQVLLRDGGDIHKGARAVRVDGMTVHLADGTAITSEKLLVATGRTSQLGQLGLETVGLDPAGRSIPVDGHMRAADGIWAVGDVTGHGAFTHMSMYQAAIAIRDILGQPGPPADYKALPRVTFTDPEIGAVGLTEAQARHQGIHVKTAVSPLPESSRGFIHKAGNDGFIKLVADADRDILVGATSAGPTGGEVLGALTVAVHAQVPLEMLRHMIYAYPTFHRAIEDAVHRLD
ncbi:pyridine nucleotide-disulfide oxidoreductase [Catellatospora sp. TT07R-123]|uniref:dihydrolipoyl dehydrogenase family protein n=1 Tax=Catellatospora sp. TT07R-123 TaxID=2733863 RepID=UPI001B12BFFA|nr:NAD(P)/FAD-dependent oxidoreductase [Catellatospora sp. TT07R-123]GHJ49492.1 pyridine nucleotide-disulfide oxidoreductase [Catellatospora sp. TT07R-123]